MVVLTQVWSLWQPGLRQPSWTDQEVRADVLQAVLPQQRQGHRLHQGMPYKASNCGDNDAHL